MRILELRLKDQSLSLGSFGLNIVLPEESLFALATGQMVWCRGTRFIFILRESIVAATIVVVIAILTRIVILIVLREVNAIRGQDTARAQ